MDFLTSPDKRLKIIPDWKPQPGQVAELKTGSTLLTTPIERSKWTGCPVERTPSFSWRQACHGILPTMAVIQWEDLVEHLHCFRRVFIEYWLSRIQSTLKDFLKINVLRWISKSRDHSQGELQFTVSALSYGHRLTEFTVITGVTRNVLLSCSDKSHIPTNTEECALQN